MNFNKKIALFPGSFDPITLGHSHIIKRALKLFDSIIIAIGNNFKKKYMFSLKKRKYWIEKTFYLNSKIKIESYKELTISFCKKKKIKFILRGLRNFKDFEFEKNIFFSNQLLTNNKIETIFLLSYPNKSYISSAIVREIIKKKGNYSLFVPQVVKL